MKILFQKHQILYNLLIGIHDVNKHTDFESIEMYRTFNSFYTLITKDKTITSFNAHGFHNGNVKMHLLTFSIQYLPIVQACSLHHRLNVFRFVF